MLVLTRKVGERIHIGNNIIVAVVAIEGQRVRIGIEAPRDIPIRREELPDTSVVVPVPREKKEASHAFGHPPSGG